MIYLLKDIFKAIKSKKALYIILYIQLVITFFTVILSSSSIGYLTEYKLRVKNFTKENWVQTEVTNPIKIHSLEQNIDVVKTWYTYMISREEVQNYGYISTGGRASYGADEMDSTKSAKICYVNKMFIDIYNNDIESGEKLTDTTEGKWSKKIISVLISNDLKSIFKIGSIIDNRYKVVGILKPKVEVPLSKDFSTLTTIDNKFIISPLGGTDGMPEAFINGNYYDIYVQNSIVELKNKNDYKSFKEAVDKKAEELGLPLRVTSPENSMDQTIKGELLIRLAELCVTVVLIILSVLGNIAVYLSISLRKKREFGIRLALGASIENLCKSIVTEVALLIVSSLMIATGIHYLIYRIINYHNENHAILLRSTGMITIGLITSTTLIMIFIISIIPILKVKKFQPSELIREVK
jgi:ABC-type transport system, involved in lipoprotein release, permease component